MVMLYRASRHRPIFWATLAVTCLTLAHLTFRVVLTLTAG